MKHHRPNPMRDLLRQEMGIDAFALDGDEGELAESWTDRPRPPGRPPAIVVH